MPHPVRGGEGYINQTNEKTMFLHKRAHTAHPRGGGRGAICVSVWACGWVCGVISVCGWVMMKGMGSVCVCV